MSTNQEVEIKFKFEDIKLLAVKLHEVGFHLVTERTHEMNTLYDLPGEPLRHQGALLRIRKYGLKWTVTYKDKSQIKQGRHKSRREIETPVQDGQALADILRAVGFKPGFAYEKFRSEWSGGTSTPSHPKPGRAGDPGTSTPSHPKPGRAGDPGTGHVVIDETPIGNFGEIEGPPQWIDDVARRLGIAEDQYITASYAELFMKWKRTNQCDVTEMLFPL